MEVVKKKHIVGKMNDSRSIFVKYTWPQLHWHVCTEGWNPCTLSCQGAEWPQATFEVWVHSECLTNLTEFSWYFYIYHNGNVPIILTRAVNPQDLHLFGFHPVEFWITLPFIWSTFQASCMCFVKLQRVFPPVALGGRQETVIHMHRHARAAVPALQIRG